MTPIAMEAGSLSTSLNSLSAPGGLCQGSRCQGAFRVSLGSVGSYLDVVEEVGFTSLAVSLASVVVVGSPVVVVSVVVVVTGNL